MIASNSAWSRSGSEQIRLANRASTGRTGAAPCGVIIGPAHCQALMAWRSSLDVSIAIFLGLAFSATGIRRVSTPAW